jgi:hypothetical protein
MEEQENIKLMLEDHFPLINKFLGDIIERGLEIPDYRNSLLISQLLKAASKLPAFEENKYSEDEDYDDFYYDDEDYFSDSFKLDSGLYLLNKTLYYGERYCEGFNCIFNNVNIQKQQEAENRITEILAQVKAFEFLSKVGFRNITTVDRWQNKLQVEYSARKSPDYHAVVVTRLYSAKYIEEHLSEYNEEHFVRLLTSDISYAINQEYHKLEQFCKNHVGVDKGIIFVSGGRDYFGNKKLENTLYGLKLTKVMFALNKEWQIHKTDQKSYQYLNHIVITTGRNIRNAIVYPSLN